MGEEGVAQEGKKRRFIFGLITVIALMIGFMEVPMLQAQASAHVKNVVLVHGGFVDGSGWRGVYDRLTSVEYLEFYAACHDLPPAQGRRVSPRGS